jgi:hypothetical protein
MTKKHHVVQDSTAVVAQDAEIGKPKAGYIRIVTAHTSGPGGNNRKVTEFADIPLKVKGEANPVVIRYIRKFEAKKKGKGNNSIIDIIYPPDYKPPKMSDSFIENGVDEAEKSVNDLSMKEFMEMFVTAMKEKK